ncbi:MAG: hypothetical protein HS126_21100 [Anaerolineales bacterium]|nr:hypothetical protein [Anaerolineales bacterium]
MNLKSKIENTQWARCRKSKIQDWLPWLALSLIIVGQLNYLPARLDFLYQLGVLAQADVQDATRLAYGAASYNLLAWVEQNTTPNTTLLLLTTSPQTYGDPVYVLYHRALYHLYPRTVWWAAPVPPTRYPAWWTFTDLTEVNILALAQKYYASAILADGFTRPPIPGQVLVFDADTQLIFIKTGGQKPLTFQPSDAAPSLSPFGLFLRALGAILSIWLWGDALSGANRNGGASSWPRRLAAGWLLGCGLTSLAVFILLWAGLSLTVAVSSLSLLGGLLWLYLHWKNFHSLSLPLCSPRLALRAGSPLLSFPRFPASLSSLFLALILLQVGLVAFAAWASPLADWDAWVNWASKARAIFIDQTLSPALYHNLARLPTNQDYPLMLPLVEAWFYTWLGQIHEPAINLISLLFYTALLLLFYHAARLLVSPAAAAGFTTLLATVPRLERPASSGLADIPLAALVFLSFLLLFEIFITWPSDNHSRTLLRSPRLALRAGSLLLALSLSTAFLPWFKNEGWLWWIGITLSLGVGLALQIRRKHLSRHEAVVCFLLYITPTLALPLLWQLFLILFGAYRFTFLPLTLATFWTNLPRLPLIGWHMLIRLLNPYWNFVWLFAGLILLSRRQRILSAPLGWLILPGLGYLGVISISFVFSRFDPFLDHLNNSAERLILQATPLLVWWLLGQSVAAGWVRAKSEELLK